VKALASCETRPPSGRVLSNDRCQRQKKSRGGASSRFSVPSSSISVSSSAKTHGGVHQYYVMRGEFRFGIVARAHFERCRCTRGQEKNVDRSSPPRELCRRAAGRYTSGETREGGWPCAAEPLLTSLTVVRGLPMPVAQTTARLTGGAKENSGWRACEQQPSSSRHDLVTCLVGWRLQQHFGAERHSRRMAPEARRFTPTSDVDRAAPREAPPASPLLLCEFHCPRRFLKTRCRCVRFSNTVGLRPHYMRWFTRMRSSLAFHSKQDASTASERG